MSEHNVVTFELGDVLRRETRWTNSHITVFNNLFSLGGFVAGGAARVLGRKILTDKGILQSAQSQSRIFREQDQCIYRYFDCTATTEMIERASERKNPLWKSLSGDVDFWFNDHHSADLGVSFIEDFLKTEFQSKQFYCGTSIGGWAKEYFFENRIFQIIIKLSGNPKDVVNTFDIKNATCYIDANGFHYTDEWLDLERSNSLAIQNFGKDSLIWRVNKWFTKHGYDNLAYESQEGYANAMLELTKRALLDNSVKRYNVPVGRNHIRAATRRVIDTFDPKFLILASLAYDNYDQLTVLRNLSSKFETQHK